MRTDILQQAQAIRKSMDAAAKALTDEQAASAPMIYRAWSGNGVNYAVGESPSANLNVQLTVYNVKEV